MFYEHARLEFKICRNMIVVMTCYVNKFHLLSGAIQFGVWYLLRFIKENR